MRFVSVIAIVIFLVACSACKQNGDPAKNRQAEFEEISKEVDALEGISQTDNTPAAQTTSKAPTKQLKIINVYPHDSIAYTQGLLFHDGKLYESTGLRGHSTLRITDVKSGNIEKQVKLRGSYFAEGLELINNKLYQLTWVSQTCLVYDAKTLELQTQFSYRGQGWGLGRYNDLLVMSNGSSILQFINPENFLVVKTFEVRDGGTPVRYLNELEYIEGEIWANIYQANTIARINPETGTVNSWLDLTPLVDYLEYGDYPDVLNGIAYDKENKRIFLTGKLWKYMFEIEVVE